MKYRNQAAKYSTSEYFDRLEAAAYLNLSANTLDRWRCQKLNLPYHKIGGAIRYKKSDLDSYLEQHRVSVGAA